MNKSGDLDDSSSVPLIVKKSSSNGRHFGIGSSESDGEEGANIDNYHTDKFCTEIDGIGETKPSQLSASLDDKVKLVITSTSTDSAIAAADLAAAVNKNAGAAFNSGMAGNSGSAGSGQSRRNSSYLNLISNPTFNNSSNYNIFNINRKNTNNNNNNNHTLSPVSVNLNCDYSGGIDDFGGGGDNVGFSGVGLELNYKAKSCRSFIRQPKLGNEHRNK